MIIVEEEMTNTTEDYDAPEVEEVPKPNFENKKTYKNKGPEPEPPQSSADRPDLYLMVWQNKPYDI